MWNYARMGISKLGRQKLLPVKNRVVSVLRTFTRYWHIVTAQKVQAEKT